MCLLLHEFRNGHYLLFEYLKDYMDGLKQDCNNPIANALQLLQSIIKPSIYYFVI